MLRYVKQEFSCDDCNLKKGPDNRHGAQLPRTFSFNKILSIDYLYVNFQETQVAVLNMVCIGTNYHVAVRAPPRPGTNGGTPTAATTWKLFLETWVRYLGALEMVICDAGNEFKGTFERSLEGLGILQHVILPESPWQNAKAERHGGWLKSKLDAEINSGRCAFDSIAELDEFLAQIKAVKNRWFSKGGFTPTQLVFGQLPHVPGDFLSDDHLGMRGLAASFQDPHEIDTAAGEFRTRFHIRERARQAAMEQTSKDAILRASKAATHQSRVWAPGQWVYVFRRAKSNQDLHPMDRWVGPGVVVLSNNQVIYVTMRTRLWRCSSEQLRAALPSEVFGRELATDPGLSGTSSTSHLRCADRRRGCGLRGSPHCQARLGTRREWRGLRPISHSLKRLHNKLPQFLQAFCHPCCLHHTVKSIQ